MEKNQDKIVWTLLCQNPLGYELLKTAVLKNILPQYVIYNNPNIYKQKIVNPTENIIVFIS